MSEKIEPALSAQRWAELRADGDIRLPVDKHIAPAADGVTITVGPGYDTPAGTMSVGSEFGQLGLPAEQWIALANAALPDSDPRKITRARVEMLRQHSREFDLAEWADALESYLKPEPTT